MDRAVDDFLRYAKTSLRQEPNNLSLLIYILSCFQPLRECQLEVSVEAGRLLAGRPVLIQMFNDFFLPRPFWIPTAEIDKSKAFINKVADRFGNNPHAYATFLGLLMAYVKVRPGSIPFERTTHEMLTLLQNHPDLQLEFFDFLFEETASSSESHNP